MEFSFFTAFTRQSFDLLVELASPQLNIHPITPRFGTPQKKHLSMRIFTNHDIIAMVLKAMTSIAEPKDIYVQFGATATSFHHYVVMGTKCLVHVLSDDRREKIYWDRSAESLEKSAKRTSGFMKIPGVVGMLDGMKRATSTLDDRKSQNRDYNGWTGDVNRNVLLLWDPFGKIIDAVVNTPGSYHDSRAALWGEIYNHISTLPKNYKAV